MNRIRLERMPARSIVDVALAEDAYRADFEITDKYQAFSAELVRLSLLGIAGYGFLLSNIALRNSSTFLHGLTHAVLLAVGVLALGLGCGCALAHRFYSTDCLAHQVTILRLLQRIGSVDWTQEERQVASKRLEAERVAQRRDLRSCRWLLVCASSLLLVGALSVAITFAVALL